MLFPTPTDVESHTEEAGCLSSGSILHVPIRDTVLRLGLVGRADDSSWSRRALHSLSLAMRAPWRPLSKISSCESRSITDCFSLSERERESSSNRKQASCRDTWSLTSSRSSAVMELSEANSTTIRTLGIQYALCNTRIRVTTLYSCIQGSPRNPLASVHETLCAKHCGCPPFPILLYRLNSIAQYTCTRASRPRSAGL